MAETESEMQRGGCGTGLGIGARKGCVSETLSEFDFNDAGLTKPFNRINEAKSSDQW